MKTLICLSIIAVSTAAQARHGVHHQPAGRHGPRPAIQIVVGGGHAAGGVFHDALAPHGRWYRTDAYGLVWQPTVGAASRSWRPYCDRGAWIWTEHGWHWKSRYPWGWVAFHYGRWAYTRHLRWVWVPGYEWGPAWVTWKFSADWFAWAPMGPSYPEFHTDLDRYVYVPCDRFLSPHLRTHSRNRRHSHQRRRHHDADGHGRPLGRPPVIHKAPSRKHVSHAVGCPVRIRHIAKRILPRRHVPQHVRKPHPRRESHRLSPPPSAPPPQQSCDSNTKPKRTTDRHDRIRSRVRDMLSRRR